MTTKTISLIAGVLVAMLSVSDVCATNYIFTSGAGWKSTNPSESLLPKPSCSAIVGDAGPSWTQLGFPDSNWRQAYTPWVAWETNWIWDWPGSGDPNPNNGTLGPDEALFRFTFDLDGVPVNASLSLGIDDDIQLYVNGILRYQDLSGGGTNFYQAGIQDWFQPGQNVVAAYAWNNNVAGECTGKPASEAGRKALVIRNLVIETVPLPALSCVGFEPPVGDEPVTVRGNRAIPFKVVLLDEFDQEFTDADLVSPPVIQVAHQPAEQDAVDISADATAIGTATSGNTMIYSNEGDGGHWVYIMKVKNTYEAPGTYIVTVQTGDASEYRIDPTCFGQFVVY